MNLMVFKGGFRPSERRLAFIAGGVIGTWMLVSWLVQPLWDRARDLKEHIETQKQKLDSFRRLLAQAADVDREHSKVSSYLSRGDTERSGGLFLNELETLCRNSGVHMNLKPKPSKREERLNRFEVELDLEGSQNQLMSFLDSLFNMPRLIAIERLRISIAPTKEQLLRLNLVIQDITFTT